MRSVRRGSGSVLRTVMALLLGLVGIVAVMATTTFTDTNVTNGQTYDYIVESVDASGVTSAPSNMAAVPIP